MALTSIVAGEALEALRRCCTETGLKASGRLYGHNQIWARDTGITALGAAVSGDRFAIEAIRRSLQVLRQYQAPNGCIPNHFDLRTREPNYRAYADGGLWWIVATLAVEPEPDIAAIRRVLQFYECQDVDQTGLISMQEASDWQDLFCTRGKGLYLNSLYVVALESAAQAFKQECSEDEEQSCRLRAALVRQRINEHFWYRGDGNMLPHVMHTFSTTANTEYDSLGRKRWLPEKHVLVDQQYYLPYLSFRTPGEWFDTLGHLLAILAGIAGPERSRYLLHWMDERGLTERPAVALYPPVQPDHPDWRPYYGTLNAPHHYHNGGVWPFIGGFYVAALCAAGEHRQAGEALTRLALLNRAGLFNEWHMGSTGDPMGVEDQAWSAGMYLYAYHCVENGRTPLFPATDINATNAAAHVGG